MISKLMDSPEAKRHIEDIRKKATEEFVEFLKIIRDDTSEGVSEEEQLLNWSMALSMKNACVGEFRATASLIVALFRHRDLEEELTGAREELRQIKEKLDQALRGQA